MEWNYIIQRIKKEEVINKPGSVLDDHLSRIIITNNFKRFLEV